jgi:hypothetical protein
VHRDLLRHQFPENQREIRQHEGDEKKAHIPDSRHVRNQGLPCDELCQWLRKPISGIRAREKAGQRDGYLRSGQKMAGPLYQREDVFRLLVALVRHPLDFVVIDRNDRDLAHRKKSVDQNQDQQYQ